MFNNNNNNRGVLSVSTREGTHNSMAGQYGLCRPLNSSFPTWVFPLPATQPYVVKPLHIHGATDYGRQNPHHSNNLLLRFALDSSDISATMLTTSALFSNHPKHEFDYTTTSPAKRVCRGRTARRNHTVGTSKNLRSKTV